MLELSKIIPLVFKYLLDSEATISSIQEIQYVHFKHNYFGFFNLSIKTGYDCPMIFVQNKKHIKHVCKNVEIYFTIILNK